MAGDMSGGGGFLGSWSTPLVIHVADHDELIVSEVSRVASYDPRSGEGILDVHRAARAGDDHADCQPETC